MYWGLHPPRGRAAILGWTWLCCVISRDGSKNFNIRTCEHIILGRLRMGARQAKNAPLFDTLPNVQCSVNCGFGAKNIFLTEDHWLVVEGQSSSFLSSGTLSDICPLHKCFLPTAPFEWICQTKKYRSQDLALWNSMTSKHKTWNFFLPLAVSSTTTPHSF